MRVFPRVLLQKGGQLRLIEDCDLLSKVPLETGLQPVPTVVSSSMVMRLPIPFIGRKMTDAETQQLIRTVNNMRDDLRIALREIQDLKERVERLENVQ